MSVTKFESEVKLISASIERVYAKLSDLSNVESVKDRIPTDKVKDLHFDSDSLSFSVSPVGTIKLRIVEREELKTIKFETEKSPVPFNLWIQLLPGMQAEQTRLKLTIGATLNPFTKGMVSKPLTDGVHKLAEVLANIPY
ncbi:MAG TPA: SRPBCC family protein [Bacteroidaceae bacterium]|nr:SRPBCC family protein [Bacteroidaceae bacterium]